MAGKLVLPASHHVPSARATGLVATEVAAQNAPVATTPGVTRKILSVMDQAHPFAYRYPTIGHQVKPKPIETGLVSTSAASPSRWRRAITPSR
jgi:hypothetical protein